MSPNNIVTFTDVLVANSPTLFDNKEQVKELVVLNTLQMTVKLYCTCSFIGDDVGTMTNFEIHGFSVYTWFYYRNLFRKLDQFCTIIIGFWI